MSNPAPPPSPRSMATSDLTMFHRIFRPSPPLTSVPCCNPIFPLCPLTSFPFFSPLHWLGFACLYERDSTLSPSRSGLSPMFSFPWVFPSLATLLPAFSRRPLPTTNLPLSHRLPRLLEVASVVFDSVRPALHYPLSTL